MKIINKTPYYIRYQKGPKIQKGFSFEVEGDVNINQIEVWYGEKWTNRPEIDIETKNTIVFKKIIYNEQREELPGINSLLKSNSIVGNIFKKIF